MQLRQGEEAPFHPGCKTVPALWAGQATCNLARSAAPCKGGPHRFTFSAVVNASITLKLPSRIWRCPAGAPGPLEPVPLRGRVPLSGPPGPVPDAGPGGGLLVPLQLPRGRPRPDVGEPRQVRIRPGAACWGGPWGTVSCAEGVGAAVTPPSFLSAPPHDVCRRARDECSGGWEGPESGGLGGDSGSQGLCARSRPVSSFWRPLLSLRSALWMGAFKVQCMRT